MVWATVVDEQGETVTVDLRTNEAGLPICGESGPGTGRRCIVMRYNGRRHDSPHIFWDHLAAMPLIITQIRCVFPPPWARGDDETGD